MMMLKAAPIRDLDEVVTAVVWYLDLFEEVVKEKARELFEYRIRP